jgi:UDP-N-acetylglucosamine--N-acetylmuramyl-(pentapeptide) pyrophosphoryl-undecaprenol N-acetylglucosamine transferase
VPVIIYLPDIEPGLAIKFLARFARRVAVTAPEAQKFFKPGLTVVTGYPVRDEFFNTPLAPSGRSGNNPPAAARKRGWGESPLPVSGRGRGRGRQLGLTDDLPVLMVFGGSRGARSLNQAVMQSLEAWLPLCQIIHVTGTLDEAPVQVRRAELSPEWQARYHVSAYLHEEMVTALLAADLVISRAGASVLGEFPAAGLPAILAPYPYAGAHQWLNANYLAQHQAALVIDDADLAKQLKDTVLDLFTNKEKLAAMRQACQKLAQPDAAMRLAQAIVEVKPYG